MAVKHQPYKRMPSYLLNAPQDDFERWRAAAESTGQTFASYVRDALDSHTASLARAKQSQLPSWLAKHYADHYKPR